MKKTKKSSDKLKRRLTLVRTTVRKLNDDKLGDVRGGMFGSWCWCPPPAPGCDEYTGR